MKYNLGNALGGGQKKGRGIKTLISLTRDSAHDDIALYRCASWIRPSN